MPEPISISALPPITERQGVADDVSIVESQRHELVADSITLEISGKMLLDNINLQFSRTGITAILGYNGAGKSLLLRVLHGLIAADSGSVLWDGQRLNDELRLRQAMVFQKPVMLRRTVMDNLRFVLNTRNVAAAEVDDRATQLLSQMGLESLAKQAARRLSGGEQQRLALARALAVEPLILFLDEATANLDPASTRRIESVVADAAANGTKVVMVTHDLAQVRRLAHEVVYLENGKVGAQGLCSVFFEQQSGMTNPGRDRLGRFLRGELPPTDHPHVTP